MQEFATVLQKYEDRLQKTSHVDGKQLALNYIFPLLRKLAGTVVEAFAEHEEAIRDLEEALESDGAALNQARDTIVMLSGLLDETMLAAGFYITTSQGLQDTGKAPQELREKFVEAAQQVVATMQAIEEELNGEDDEDAEVEPDGADGAQAVGQSEGGDAVIASAASVATGLATAREPDAIYEANEPQGNTSASADQGSTNAAE
jgi:hypothetical protein